MSDSKRLTQTKISTYFSGCIKSLPTDETILKKRKTRRSRRKLSFTSAMSSDRTESRETTPSRKSYDRLSLNNASPSATVQKRKLPAPIFSDDEDSENDHRSGKSPKRVDHNSPLKEPKVLTSLNKPGPSSSPQKSCTPSNTSTQSSPGISSNSNTELNNNSPEKNQNSIRILQNVVLTTPKKSPQKEPIKDGKKKVNYEQLRVIREFFINVFKNNQLKSLLTKVDTELLFKFFNIEKDYQYVCVKLFLWKPIWYNIFNFVEKIGLSMEERKIVEMYNCLKEQGFVDVDYMQEDLFTLLDLLPLKNVRDIARSYKFSDVSRSKEVIISKFLKHCKTQVTLTTSQMNSEDVLKERIKEKLGYCLKLSNDLSRCMYSVFLLNTFTNHNLHVPQEYFTNVGYFNMVFPNYDVEKFHVFYTPQEFSRYADGVKLRIQLNEALEKRNMNHVFEICQYAYNKLRYVNEQFGDSFESFDETHARPAHLERFTPNAQYVSILSSGSKHVTTSNYEHVMIWFEYLISQGYCAHKRGYWYSHLALIYTQYIKDYVKAAKLLIKAFREDQKDFSDIHLQELLHRAKMLNKKSYNLPSLFHDELASLLPETCERNWPQDIVDSKSIPSEEPGRRRVYIHRCENGDVNYLTVEQTALKYYESMGFPNGEHCEGSLITASFCLLFWDIIYSTKSYVKGAFVSDVQNSPLDMYTKYFYINRQRSIDKRLKEIGEKWKDEELKKKVIDNCTLHSHETTLCAIDTVGNRPEYLYNMIMSIGRSTLARIFERLVKNFHLYNSGFPDLIVWNFKEKKAKFVEVKSENDKLSIKQKLWLNYLMDIGASVAVCHVEGKSSKKKNVMKTKSSSS